MKTSQRSGAERARSRTAHLLLILMTSLASAWAQKYEITPLVGGIFGGTLKLEQPGLPNAKAHVQDSLSYGIAGGIRFDGDDCQDCNMVEFRWIRQDTHLELTSDPLVPTPLSVLAFRPSVTLDRFLGDFTHEFSIEDVSRIKPFLTATLGAAHMAAPASGATRFVFGIGAGTKVFLTRHWGFRLYAEYLPVVRYASLQRLACGGGACTVVLNGGVMSQFQLSFGPSARF